jgi:hypothetical protein
MMQRIGIAIGAGLAAALLFALTAKDTMLAATLASLAPLPIVIATLGWGLDMGALAAAVAGVAAAALVDPVSGVLFAATIALPSWILCFAALQPLERFYPRAAAIGGQKTWFPIGGIVAFAAIIGAVIGLSLLATQILAYGGYRKSVESIAAAWIPDLKEAFDGVVALPDGVTIENLAAMAVRLKPAILAASTCLMLCANLYAGARAVQMSERLRRPWPNLPEALVLPRILGVGLVACAGLAVTLRGSGADVAWIGVGALGCAYAMQGLAVIHSLSRGLPVRVPALVALYLGCFFTALLSLPALALVGLIETMLSLRARRATAANAKS